MCVTAGSDDHLHDALLFRLLREPGLSVSYESSFLATTGDHEPSSLNWTSLQVEGASFIISLKRLKIIVSYKYGSIHAKDLPINR